MFYNQTLPHIFASQNGSCLLTLYKNTQIRVYESGHATVKRLTEIVKFKILLKITLSQLPFLE